LLKKLEKPLQQRIHDALKNKISINPYLYLEPFHGIKKDLFKHRVGDYGVICEIKNEKLVVLVFDAGHRREVYH
jgi:mRNA interferase RelE/StbE